MMEHGHSVNFECWKRPFPLLFSWSVNSCDPLFLWIIALKWFCLKVGYHRIRSLIIPLALPPNSSVFRQSRCFFFNSAFGCRKGTKCAFCHHRVTLQQAELSTKSTRKVQRQKIRSSLEPLIEQLDVVSQQPQDKGCRSSNMAGKRWFDPISAIP